MKWVDETRLRFDSCGWRFCIPVSASFVFLSLFFVYDRSYLDSAIVVLDHQLTPLFPSYRGAARTSVQALALRQAPVSGSEPESEPLLSAGPAPVTAPCNIFDGKWVFDDSYPLYETCQLAEKNFLCHENGRPDRKYQKWRWQPHECSIPRFNAHDMLERLKGLRVVIVGDSMGRTQWESLSCLLLQGVPNKSSVKMIQGPITRQKPHLGIRFNDHNVTIDYYRSPFLVDGGPDVPERSPKRVRSTLKLKKMDLAVARNIVDADLLLINTGHWWTQRKTIRSGCYFEEDNKLMLGLTVMEAYEKALSTITSWVNDNVDFNRTEVFFRSYEPPHPELKMATQPYTNISNPEDYPRARILKEAVGLMETPAAILNITFLSSFRPDGHIFNWSALKIVDRAHWCLPGVPDTWNELLYASLLSRGRGVWAVNR